jgi:hypothetical protein
LRIIEVANQCRKEIRLDFIVAVNDRDELSIRCRMTQSKVEGAGFSTRQRVHVKKAKAVAQALTMRLNGFPQRRISSVVVDDQNLEIRIA